MRPSVLCRAWTACDSTPVHCHAVSVISRTVVVSAVIVMVAGGYAEVEMCPVIIVVDAEDPSATIDNDRPEEVFPSQEFSPLPSVKHIVQVLVSAVVITVIESVHGSQTAEVIVIYLVNVLNLVVGQIQLVSHLVGEEASFFSGAFHAEGLCLHASQDNGQEGENHLFHNAMYLSVIFSFWYGKDKERVFLFQEKTPKRMEDFPYTLYNIHIIYRQNKERSPFRNVLLPQT